MTFGTPPDLRLTTSVVAGLRFVDDPASLADATAQAYARSPHLITLLAAHVTALNAVDDPDFRAAFNEADAGYIDGISWVLLARLHGDRPSKLATTDLAPAVIRSMADALDRPVRVAVLGGPTGSRLGMPVAAAAARTLQQRLPVEIVHTTHGYHEDWSAALDQVRQARPDVVLVGLGMPLEARWVHEHRAELPPAVVLTCGGWLRILAGLEERAPLWMQRLNLEWAHRLSRDPRRTAARYSNGVVTVLRYGAVALAHRALFRTPALAAGPEAPTRTGARS